MDIVNPGSTSGELGFSIDRVDYRITCAGNPAGTYPIPAADTTGTDYAYNDSVDISGAFEVIDTNVPPVWQAVMDLPPGDCTVTLSVYYQDEVVCVGSQTLAIAEDATTKYDIVLVCSLSIDTPDGMADIDGTFTFITGNLCPKLYVLNAISSVIDITANPRATEIQYRAKDPDNTCGNNCDPQSCTTDNPPVCTPAPYNPNDPLCNPAAGGDPTSAACLANGAGLVCTIVANETTGGAFAGTFISPADGVTPVGPVLPVNLNTAAGIPGFILPGLGGPAGTNAENSPAYPPIPNLNGSLPPLVYVCDPSYPGAIAITVQCSDGDAECDQQKTIILSCPAIDYFCDPPIDCSSSGECLTDGVCNPGCNPVCDPTQPLYDATACCAAPNPTDSCGALECANCPGRNFPRAPGTVCTEGSGSVCDGAGSCVECIDSQNTGFPQSNPNCDSTPVDCLLPSVCSGNACQPRAVAPDGTVCSNGVCSGGTCVFDPIDPCQDTDPALCTKVITVGCTGNVTADISILPFTQTTDPDPIIGSSAVTGTTTGIVEFSETFLDAAQGAVPGGVTAANLVDLQVPVQVRSGGTFPNVVLGPDPALVYTCLYSGGTCDPANDLSSIPGSRGNSGCIPTGAFNPCGRIVNVPISSDCSSGGVCDTLGKNASQCLLNGFCVTGGLPLQLSSGAISGTAAASGNILFGWYDDAAVCPFPAGSLCTLPAAVFVSGTCAAGGDLSCLNTAPMGFRVNVSGLSVALQCNQAVDGGTATTSAVTSADSDLISFSIQVP